MVDIDNSWAGRLIGGGKYELLEPTGAGAMGVVWLARHVALDRIVAVKLLHKAITDHPDAHERFVREAQTASALRHKHMVQVLDFGGDPETGLFLVMEYVEGRNLSEVMTEEGRIAPARALTIASQVLAGLAEAHEMGIIHRDIKPGNVMLLPMVDDDGVEREQVKVFDFGIATMRDAAKASREIAGTPEYMSPEQVRGTDLDHRSDVYSVGIMLYAMLTGAVPFSFESAMDTMLAQVNKAPPLLRQKDARFSPGLEDVVARALAKSADARFANARAFRAALLALPELSMPVPTPVRVEIPASPMATVRAERTPARSSRGWLVAAAAIVLLVGGGLGLWGAGVFGSSAPATVEQVAAKPDVPKPEPEAKVEVAKTEPAPAKVEPEKVVVVVPAPVAIAPTEPAKVEVAEVQPVEVAPAPEKVEVAKVEDKDRERRDRERRERERDRERLAKLIETPKHEPAKVEPVAAPVEPAKVEPAAIEPAKVEPAKVEPVVAHEPAKVEPAKVEPAKVEPVKVVPPSPTFVASAGIGNLAVRGSLPRSSVSRALDSARSGLEQCYATASRGANRDAACSAPVTFIIDLDGRVRGVNVGALPLPGLSACASGAIGRVRVKDRPDTGTVEASFHLRFTPQGH